jgi:hypothetical protein
MYSPEPRRARVPFAEPRFGAGPEADPGFVASLREQPPTMLGRLRVMMLTLAAAPVLIFALIPFLVRGGQGLFGALPYWIFAPLAAAFAGALLGGLRVPRPLTPGGDAARAAEAAAVLFRQAMLLRFALSEAVILLGLALAVLTHSQWTYAAGFVLGYPLLIVWALPTRGMVERVRRRLEGAGAESHLWAALLAAAPPR